MKELKLPSEEPDRNPFGFIKTTIHLPVFVPFVWVELNSNVRKIREVIGGRDGGTLASVKRIKSEINK